MQCFVSSQRLLVIAIFIFLSLISADVYAQSSSANEASLESIFEQAEEISSLRSVLIQQNGDLLGEEYFRNATPDHPYNIKSASKSVISLLTGIAVDQGEISIDETLDDYFPEYFDQNPDSVKANITIRQLLSMQAGLETTSFYNYGRWAISDNWVEFQLDQPMTEEPGGKMVYSTGISHLLSVIITKASGMSTQQFANRYLFDPLDIQPGGWDRDPQGYYMGGNNLALTPQALLKIGQLMLNGGEYNGQRIVSKKWVRDSFGSYTRSNFNPYNYGYMWWNREVGGQQVFFAWGFGGQYIFMIPELDAVVVMTSFLDRATQRRTYKEPVFTLLEESILPLLEQQSL
ncbi:serine hydrolase domain-containing protein [Gracilimonas mengyeensis]|uniref:CubicO group peptidase, beta-lactamase class C family n=1 Tax=Gracilimonas mengyeensis TaxID=1302730 RepID=A0A521F749_9BACT|nr:serine hydrolase [Gracilimonas mengyeensis]SMO91914.1 CubicO group peptidase, beta-lactamase class C family [Gracilimonas mengyeensis]